MIRIAQIDPALNQSTKAEERLLAAECLQNILPLDRMSDFFRTMTEIPPNIPEPNSQSDSAAVDVEELLQLLRRKESNWVKWGQACQHLQKAGYNSQTIFEATGFR